ncbi:hypothetical protein BRARA_I03191 [Brassica rapa]|uniref:Uncharacterized protein n=1 Tax=Brassica campestris TaxID=3711 RepID=A0A397XYT3_BRACM|nr:hypothetical protein BRARA_I03191 [Brassica rapa]
MEMMWSMVMLGRASFPSTRFISESRLSLRPYLTLILGPPTILTRLRVAPTRMSEHETTLGHFSSRAVLIRVIRSNASPGREWLMSASRSEVLPEVEATRIEASQPSTMQSWKKRRSVPAAVVGAAICLSVTTWTSVWSKSGHVLL